SSLPSAAGGAAGPAFPHPCGASPQEAGPPVPQPGPEARGSDGPSCPPAPRPSAPEDSEGSGLCEEGVGTVTTPSCQARPPVRPRGTSSGDGGAATGVPEPPQRGAAGPHRGEA